MELAICVIAISVAAVAHKALDVWLKHRQANNEWADDIERRIESLEKETGVGPAGQETRDGIAALLDQSRQQVESRREQTRSMIDRRNGAEAG